MSTQSPKPVYALVGTDSYLRDRHRTAVLAEAIGDADPQVCVSTYDADAESADVLDDLRTPGFLSPHRVILVRDADPFVSRYRDKLEAYLESPCPTGSLVLIVKSMPSNTRLYKRIDKIGKILSCKEPSEKEIPAWLRDAARHRGAELTPKAATLMLEWVGADLSRLSGELDKLTTYVGERKRIQPEDVEAVVVASSGPGAFELTNALTRADVAAALKALGGMLTVRGEEFRTLGMIGWHLRKMVKAAEMLSTGASLGQVCREVKIPRSLSDDVAGLVRRRGRSGLERDMGRLIRADLALKTGADARGALQELVVGLCV